MDARGMAPYGTTGAVGSRRHERGTGERDIGDPCTRKATEATFGIRSNCVEEGRRDSPESGSCAWASFTQVRRAG